MTDEKSMTFETIDGVTVVRVHLSELTSRLTDMMLSQFDEMAKTDQPARLVLDLANVKFMDSIALGTLVVLLRRIKQNEGRLVLAGLGGHALKVLQVTGLEKVFDLVSSVPAAIEHVRRPS